MTGALIQLSAKTRHNKFLISAKPDLNVFNSVYIKSNNYAKEFFDLQSISEIDYNKKITFYIPKKSHYVHNIILKIKLPTLDIPSGSTFVSWTNSIGHAIIDKIECLIGEFIIDTHTDIYMEIHDELNKLNKNYYQQLGKYDSNVLLDNTNFTDYLYVPLKFWFNKDIKNALPLFLLDNNNVRIDVYLKDFQQLVVFDGNVAPTMKQISSMSLLVEYIYIEEQEIKYNLNNSVNSKEYIIEQVQSISNVMTLTQNKIVNISLKELNHPVSELIIIFTELESIENNDFYNFSKRTNNPNEKLQPLVKKIKLLIEGNERYIEQDESFYRLLLPDLNGKIIPNKFIYVLPFNNYNNSNVYSGSLNFSAIDTSNLILTMNDNINPCTISIFAINYNILKIKNKSACLEFIC